MPFFVALGLFAGMECILHSQHMQTLRSLLRGTRQLLPSLISLGAFAAGPAALFWGYAGYSQQVGLAGGCAAALLDLFPTLMGEYQWCITAAVGPQSLSPL